MRFCISYKYPIALRNKWHSNVSLRYNFIRKIKVHIRELTLDKLNAIKDLFGGGAGIQVYNLPILTGYGLNYVCLTGGKSKNTIILYLRLIHPLRLNY